MADAIELNYDDPLKKGASTDSRFDELLGRIRVVSSVPTWTPRARLDDSIALYVNGATTVLYVYDSVNSQWLPIGAGGTYAGIVAGDGTGTLLPDGWTSTRTATGEYTVTHNLGHQNYSVALTPVGGYNTYLVSANNNDFLYQIQSLGGGNTNADEHFIVAVA